MTETSLFRLTLGVLAATVLAPIIVAATGVGGDRATTGDRLDSYIANASTAQGQGVDGSKQADVSKKDTANQKDPTANEKASQATTAGAKAAGSYTVKAGDTYGCIAEQYYGSYDQWTRVYEQNAGWPGYDEYELHVGAKLQLPAVSADEVRQTTNVCS